MNLRHLSNSDLHQQTKHKADNERLATIELLWHLREVERRMLYAQMGYKDLNEYCVKELKLSGSSAWRRINAMKLLKEIPEVESKIRSGDLNLTQVTMARTHFREAKVTQQEKKEILLTLENQSTRASERILAERKPESYIPKPIEKEKALRGQKLELTIILDEELQKNLEEIELLSGRKYSKLELFKLMTKATLERLRKKSAVKNLNSGTNPLSKNTKQDLERTAIPALKSGSAQSRYIPAAVRKFVRVRDQQRCQYVDPISKRQCEAKSYLQFDHKKPFSLGGPNTSQNLQLLCSTHNRLSAIQVLGVNKMQHYQQSLK